MPTFPLTTWEAVEWWSRLADEEEDAIRKGIADPIAGGFRVLSYRECAAWLAAAAEEEDKEER